MDPKIRLIPLAIFILGLAIGGQAVQAQDAPGHAEESVSIIGEIRVDTEGDLAEQDEEITERSVPRIKIPGVGGTTKPKIKIPDKPGQKLQFPPGRTSSDQPQTGDGNQPDVEETTQSQAVLQRLVPNQVIVKLHPGMSLPSATISKFGLQALRTTSGGHTLLRFVVPPGMEQVRNPITVAEELAKLAAVIFAQPNRIYTPQRVPQDELFPQQWHFLENGNGPGQSPGGIGLPKVWDRTIGSRKVVVAVIDTGSLTNHPDISGTGNLLPGFDFISDVKKANDGNGRDPDPTDPGDGTAFGECIPGVKGSKDSWHGINVAGVIGMGRTNGTEGIAGINWLVKVLPVRVSGKCGADDFDLFDAIKWSAGLPVPDAPLNLHPARIINISLGSLGLCDRLVQEAIEEVVTKKDVSVVVAAGNNTTLAAFHAPSNCQHVITVAASDKQGRLAPYSNFGQPVMIMAPGGNRKQDLDQDGRPDGVLTLNHPALRFPEDAPIPLGFGFEMGTSLAAPHVSGVLALWLAVDPTLTNADLIKGLKENAFPRNKSQCPKSCGAGLLNADLSSLFQPDKPVPPTPGKDIPPPPTQKLPPTVPQCQVKTSDIVKSLKIDIGNNDSQTTSAKQSLLRMLSQGDVETRRVASGMVKGTESGHLAGIFQWNKAAVSARAQTLTPPKGPWDLIPKGQLGMCLTEPAGQPPMIIYSQQDMAPGTLDTTLRNAWNQCGLPDLEFPCQFIKDMENK